MRGNLRLRGKYRYDSKYPVYHTLKEIGLPAIPRLIEALKESSPEKESHRRKMIIGTIAGIFDKAQAGSAKHRTEHESSVFLKFPIKMRKTLLEMEIERTEDKKKKFRLQEALPDGGAKKRLEKEDGEEE